MAETTTITVRIPLELRDKLDRLAKAMERSRSYVAVEALERFTAQELEIIDGLDEAMAEVEAGHFYTTEQLSEEMERYFVEAAAEAMPVRKKAAGA